VTIQLKNEWITPLADYRGNFEGACSERGGGLSGDSNGLYYKEDLYKWNSWRMARVAD